MAPCLESLSIANHSNTIRSVASPVLAVGEADKDGEFLPKIEIFTFRHWHAMETAHWAYLIADVDRSCAQLAGLRRPSLALSLPCS